MSVSQTHNQNTSYAGGKGPFAPRVLASAMRSRIASARGRFVLAVMCMTFLTYLLLAQDPWWLFRAFPKEATRTLKHGVVDKVYHLVAYFGATCILMWYAASGTRRFFYGVASLVATHAVATEFLQQFVPRRTTDIDDLIANLVGVAAGVAAGMLIRRSLMTSDAISAEFAGVSVASLPGRPADSHPPSRREASPGMALRLIGDSPRSRSEPAGQCSPVAVSSNRTSFERLPLSSEQIAEVQPRQINYRLLGILCGVIGLMLVSTYAVHGWQVRRVSGSLLQTAREAATAGDTGKALNCYELYCNASPGDVNALAEFAILSDDTRNRPNGGKGVFMLFERVLRKDPTRDDVRRRLVDTAIELARYSDALSHVKVLRQTYPKEGRFDYQAGLCHESLNDYQAASDAFYAAIDDTPELIEPWSHLAWLLYSDSGQTKKADRLMLRLVQMNSQNADAWIARAKFRTRTQQFALAGDDITRALKLAPTEFRVLKAAGEVGIARARQALAEGRRPLAERIAIETESLLTRHDQSKPDQRKLDLQRIVLEAEFGSLQRAFTLADNLLKDTAPGDSKTIHTLMAEIAIEHGEAEQAIASLNQLPRSEITDGQRLRVKAGTAMAEQHWKDAAELLQTARGMLAESPTQLQKIDMNLAKCLGEAGQVERQLVVYRRILKYAPRSIEARTGLASTLARAGRYPEALAEYRQLVHLPQIRLQLAEHLIDYNRQLPEVARDWKEVLALLDAASADGDSSPQWAVLKAEVLIAKQNFDEARQLVTKARHEYPNNDALIAIQSRIADLSGDDAELARLNGKKLADTGQAINAEQHLRSTLLESPQDKAAAISLMRFYLQHDRAPQAIEVFRQYAPGMTPFELSQTYEVFGDLQRAAEILQHEVRRQPDNKVVLQKLSDLLIRNNRPDLAEPLLERLLTIQANAVVDETIRAARRSLALLLAKKQNYREYQKATALMNKNAADTSPIATTDLRTMATVLQYSPIKSDRLVAIGLLEKIDDRQRMAPEDRWQLARLYTEVGIPKQATPQYNRAAQSGFSNPQFLSDFIRHLIRSGELTQARGQLDRLPATFPQADRIQLKAEYQIVLGNAATAVAELDAFVESGTHPATRVERLILAAATCRGALATEASAHQVVLSQATDRLLRAAVDANPKQVSHLVEWLIEQQHDVEAFELLDTVWQQLPPETAANVSMEMLRFSSNRNRRERVEQYLTHSHQQSGSLELKLHLAELQSLSENHQKAEELYREILRANSRHVAALNGLAWSLAMRGHLLDEAMTFAERAIAEAGPVPHLLDTRGCVKFAQSRLRSATEDLLAAAEAGGVPATFLHLAYAQAESGDTTLAERTLAHAVENGLKVEQLHPFDRDLLNRLQSQIPSSRSDSSSSTLEL